MTAITTTATATARERAGDAPPIMPPPPRRSNRVSVSMTRQQRALLLAFATGEPDAPPVGEIRALLRYLLKRGA